MLGTDPFQLQHYLVTSLLCCLALLLPRAASAPNPSKSPFPDMCWTGDPLSTQAASALEVSCFSAFGLTLVLDAALRVSFHLPTSFSKDLSSAFPHHATALAFDIVPAVVNVLLVVVVVRPAVLAHHLSAFSCVSPWQLPFTSAGERVAPLAFQVHHVNLSRLLVTCKCPV